MQKVHIALVEEPIVVPFLCMWKGEDGKPQQGAKGLIGVEKSTRSGDFLLIFNIHQWANQVFEKCLIE